MKRLRPTLPKAREKINELFSELSKEGMNVKAQVVVGQQR